MTPDKHPTHDYMSDVWQGDGDEETVEATSQLVQVAVRQPLPKPETQSKRELSRILAQSGERVQRHPDSARAWFQHGQILSRLERYSQALECYDHALALRVDWADVWYARATVLRLLGYGKQAISSLHLAQAYQVKRSAASSSEQASDYERAYEWFNQGRAWFNLQEYDQALAAFEQSATCPTLEAESRHYHGRTLRRMGRYEEAIASFEQTLALKPKDASLWNNKGVALYNLGRYEEAIASFNRAVTMDTRLSRAWYNKARCHALQGNYGSALQNLRHALQFNPKDYRVLAQGDTDLAQLRARHADQWHQLFQQVMA